MDCTITHDQGQNHVVHRRSLAHVGLLIALLTMLMMHPAAAAAQSISYSSGPRNLISDGGFESEQSAWTLVESPYRTSDLAHCGNWSMFFGRLGNSSVFQEVTIPATARRADLGYWLRRTAGFGSSGQLYVRVYPPVNTAPFAPPPIENPAAVREPLPA